MTKVNIEPIIINIIAEEEIIRTHERKAKAAIKKNRVNELIAQGIDKELAKVMATVEMNMGL